MRQVLLDLPGPISGGGVPHQGGLVQTPNGDWYYMAFVDSYPGGRVPAWPRSPGPPTAGRPSRPSTARGERRTRPDFPPAPASSR